MKDFMHYITAGCIAFTFSCIFYLLFSIWGVFPSFTEQMLVNMLTISTMIMLLIYLTDFFPFEKTLLARVVELFSVLFVLVLAGRIFNVYPFTFFYVFSTLTIGILTYMAATIVIFISNQASAKQINATIQNRKMEGIS